MFHWFRVMAPRVRLAPVILISTLLGLACSALANTRYQPADRTAGRQPASWNFDSDPAGQAPPGTEVFKGIWTVRAEPDAPSQPNALCQTGDDDFPALKLDDTVYTDVSVSLRFKPISGRADQAAGIIFRIQDKDNYYILRANALEDNVNLYRYTRGIRIGIKEGAARVASGSWQELRLEAQSNQMRGFLDGQLVVEASDDTFAAGKVGLWTKADSVTCFDDVVVSPL